MIKTNWYKNAVVYQIYPFSFMDANNDGWGDIEGIISKLDYLKKLGVTAIWFSPLYKSPDYDYGYDISDYRDIDPKFGTLDDFKNLVSECHSRDIKVIMDMAINHSSTEHKWFKEALKDKSSQYRDYYLIREGKKKGKKIYPPTNWDSTFTGSAWEKIKDSDDYYMHLFCVEQADLNWENDGLRQEFADTFNYWMDMGVDGWRLDVFNMFSKVYPLRDAKKKIAGTGEEYYVDGPRMHEFLKELNERSFSKYDSYTVGESYSPHPDDAYNYVKEENKELDSIFNFAHLESDNNIKYFKKRFDLLKFKDGLFQPQIKYFNGGWNTLVVENHDNARANSRFGIDVNKYHYEASTFIPTILYMGFGTPFIYMGQEFGMTNAFFKTIDDCIDPVSHFVYNMISKKFHLPKKFALNCIRYGARDHARVPMCWDDSINGGFNKGTKPWMMLHQDYQEINAAKDLESNKSIFKYYQTLLKLRKDNPIIIEGRVTEYDHQNKQVIAYSRELNNEGYFIFGNFSNKPYKYQLPEYLNKCKTEIILSNYSNHEKIDNKYVLQPYESLIIKYTK